MADSVDVPTEIFVEDDALKLVMPSEHPCLCQDSGVRRARSPELRGKNILLTRLDQVPGELRVTKPRHRARPWAD